jgi:hypothetical protein
MCVCVCVCLCVYQKKGALDIALFLFDLRRRRQQRLSARLRYAQVSKGPKNRPIKEQKGPTSTGVPARCQKRRIIEAK